MHVGLMSVAISLLLVLGALTAFFLFWPSWESKHRDQIFEMVQKADEAKLNKQTRIAYDRYSEVIELTKGQHIESVALLSEIDAANQSMEQLYPAVKEQLEKESAERAARDAAERAAKEAREAAEREAVRVAAEKDAQRRAVERARREAEAEQARLAARWRVVKEGAAYKALRDEARRIHNTGQISLASEDSAYRAMSLMSEVNVQLMGLYIRQQSMLDASDVTPDVQRVLVLKNSLLLGEESAIRAIYKKDLCLLHMLSIYAQVIDARSGDSAHRFRTQIQALLKAAEDSIRFDDSAPRAISAFNDANKRALSLLSGAYGVDTSRIVQQSDLDNIANRSAWQVTDRDVMAQTQIVLEWLRKAQPAKADTIAQLLERDAIGEDSALRSAYKYKSGMADALLALILQE